MAALPKDGWSIYTVSRRNSGQLQDAIPVHIPMPVVNITTEIPTRPLLPPVQSAIYPYSFDEALGIGGRLGKPFTLRGKGELHEVMIKVYPLSRNAHAIVVRRNWEMSGPYDAVFDRMFAAFKSLRDAMWQVGEE